jgi:hypothetical protein
VCVRESVCFLVVLCVCVCVWRGMFFFCWGLEGVDGDDEQIYIYITLYTHVINTNNSPGP